MLLAIFLQKFPLLVQYDLLGTAAFGFAEFFGAAFLDLVAFAAFFGGLGRYNCLGLLD